MKNKNKIKIKKTFNKVKYRGSIIYEINNILYNKILEHICHGSYESRNVVKRKIYRFHKNKILRTYIRGKRMLNNLNFLKSIFFKFSWNSIICLQFGKMLESHLEIMRRKFKQNLYKTAIIELCIKPYKVLLKRPAQVRMGGGKGSKYWKIIYPMYPGLEILRIRGSSFTIVSKLCKLFIIKIPFKVKCIAFSRL